MFIVDYANYKFMNVYVKILISVDLTALTKKKKVITLYEVDQLSISLEV